MVLRMFCPRVFLQLRADRGTDEVRPVRVVPLLHEQVDLAQLDGIHVNRDFLGIGHIFSIYHPYGWRVDYFMRKSDFVKRKTSAYHLSGWYFLLAQLVPVAYPRPIFPDASSLV
jgi:hypothetical protein